MKTKLRDPAMNVPSGQGKSQLSFRVLGVLFAIALAARLVVLGAGPWGDSRRPRAGLQPIPVFGGQLPPLPDLRPSRGRTGSGMAENRRNPGGERDASGARRQRPSP